MRNVMFTCCGRQHVQLSLQHTPQTHTQSHVQHTHISVSPRHIQPLVDIGHFDLSRIPPLLLFVLPVCGTRQTKNHLAIETATTHWERSDVMSWMTDRLLLWQSTEQSPDHDNALIKELSPLCQWVTESACSHREMFLLRVQFMLSPGQDIPEGWFCFSGRNVWSSSRWQYTDKCSLAPVSCGLLLASCGRCDTAV